MCAPNKSPVRSSESITRDDSLPRLGLPSMARKPHRRPPWENQYQQLDQMPSCETTKGVKNGKSDSLCLAVSEIQGKFALLERPCVLSSGRNKNAGT